MPITGARINELMRPRSSTRSASMGRSNAMTTSEYANAIMGVVLAQERPQLKVDNPTMGVRDIAPDGVNRSSCYD